MTSAQIDSSQIGLQSITSDTYKAVIDAETEAVLKSKQYKRKQWYLERRSNADGSIPNIDKNNHTALINYKKSHPNHDRSVHGSWNFLGSNSTNTGGKQGRVNSIDIHPSNDQIIYLCTPNGGIWKTTTGGNSWSPLTDHLGLLSFADLEISPSDPNTIYALTGDGDPAISPLGNHGQAEVWSAGILKSTNGGSTWHYVNYNFPVQEVATKLLMHPTNSNIQFVVTKNGIYKTTNGWNTGYLVSSQYTYDIEFKPTNPNIMYSSGINKIRKSTNLGETWVEVTDPDFVAIDTANRIELAVSPDFPTFVAAIAGTWKYGSIATLTSGLDGSSNSWGIRDNSTNVIGAFASYCIALAIDPDDYNNFYGGGVNLWKSTNEGQTGSWSYIGSGVHADIHDIVINNGKIYVATDGGLFRSDNGGNSWTDLSDGLQITEIYRMSGSETNPDLYYVGTQDNGTLKRTSGSTFNHVLGADGMVNIIDYNINTNVYAMKQEGFFHKSVNGANSFTYIPTIGKGAWITPMIIDPVSSARLFIGKDTILRSTLSGNNGSWQNIGTLGVGVMNNLAQGTNNPNRLYASKNFAFFRSNNALANPASNVTWTTLGIGLPDNFITDIAVNPNDADHIIVTMGSYISGEKVYESTDGGDNYSWTNISGSLPNVPIISIGYHDDGSGLDRMYIGTDIGVFYRDDNIGDWIYFSNFMPAVPVEDLYINAASNTITAATYGRGLWRSNLFTNCPNSINVSSSVTLQGEIHYTYQQSITSAATISTQPGTSIFYKAGDFIDLKPGFLAPAVTTFEAQIGDCPY